MHCRLVHHNCTRLQDVYGPLLGTLAQEMQGRTSTGSGGGSSGGGSGGDNDGSGSGGGSGGGGGAAADEEMVGAGGVGGEVMEQFGTLLTNTHVICAQVRARLSQKRGEASTCFASTAAAVCFCRPCMVLYRCVRVALARFLRRRFCAQASGALMQSRHAHALRTLNSWFVVRFRYWPPITPTTVSTVLCTRVCHLPLLLTPPLLTRARTTTHNSHTHTHTHTHIAVTGWCVPAPAAISNALH
jgi:hypothetical protein